MKKFKKLSALLLAVIMTLAMAVPAMANDGKLATADDTYTIAVQGAKEATSITAYKLITAEYDAENDGKWTGKYVWADGVETILTNAGFDTPEKKQALFDKMANNAGENLINAEEVAKIAQAFKMANTASVGEWTKAGDVWSAELGAGQYIVLAQGSNMTVYNPMVVAAAYDKEGNVDAPGWSSSTGSVNTANGYSDGLVQVKATTITADKKQLGSTGKYLIPSETGTLNSEGKEWKDGDGVKYELKEYAYADAVAVQGGDDVHIGDVIDFELTATIPAYNKEVYTKPYFAVGDTLEAKSFTAATDIIVKVGSNEIPKVTVATGKGYRLTQEDPGTSFTVVLNPDTIHEFNGQTVTVTYKSMLKEGCDKNYDANNNTMTVSYSNNPNEKYENQPTEGDEEIKDYTNTYTFEIEFRKVEKDGEDAVKVVNHPETAEFTLYKDENCTEAIAVVNPDATTGKFSFTGLDAGTYYLKETKSPDGYGANNTVYPITITATYEEEAKKDVKFIYKETEDGQYKDKYYAIVNDEKVYTIQDPTSAETYGPFNKPTTVHDHTFKLKSVTVTGVEQTKNILTDTNAQDEPIDILNTPMTELPSTGGIGTYIFTIAGVAILAIAAFLLIFKRRKVEE